MKALDYFEESIQKTEHAFGQLLVLAYELRTVSLTSSPHHHHN